MIAPFVPVARFPIAAEWLYLVIDVLLAFALFGIYAYQHHDCGMLGFIGFVLAAIGIETIGGPDGKLGSVDVYNMGATVIGVGMVLFALGSWKPGKLPRVASIAWIVSTAVGSSWIFGVGGDIPFTIAGIAFGIGFVAAGVKLVTRPGS
jgi:hypothetical protein